jgi:hypothetical protein
MSRYHLAITFKFLSFTANPLPLPISRATAVPFGDSFLLVGGQTTGWDRLSTIYRYNAEDDSWILIKARMKHEKSCVIAMMVDRNTSSVL